MKQKRRFVFMSECIRKETAEDSHADVEQSSEERLEL
jgi:hypothetical protein